MNNQTENFLNIIRYAVNGTNLQDLPILKEPVDWKRLGELGMSHNLFALFHEVAYKYPDYEKSADYKKNERVALGIVAGQVRRTARFLELYREFLKEDLHPIVMKGIICRQLYGQYEEHRPSGDEDILVKKNEFYKVKAVMERCGYECTQPNVTVAQLEKLQDVGFREKRSGFLIEVHTNLMGHRNKIRSRMGESFNDVFEHTRTVLVRDELLTTMSHTEHYLFLVLHAYKHFSTGGVGVRQLLDILMYQQKYEQEIDWKWIENELIDNQVISYLGDLQYIGVNYLGFNVGVRFESCNPKELLEDIIEVGVFGEQGEAGQLASSINLGTAGLKKNSIFTWLRVGFPTLKFMMNEVPELEEKPWLLPKEWIKRWIRFIKRAKKYDGNLIADSVKKSEKRKKLLERYNME